MERVPPKIVHDGFESCEGHTQYLKIGTCGLSSLVCPVTSAAFAAGGGAR